MSLVAGTRLGPYEIQSAIGAGGMGEVYKARDTRLDRSVAIKVLPPEVSADPDRRARFEREAKTIAGLNHPHICTLHDVGEHEGATYLVMEHIAGETLAHRLDKGPLPLEQALTLATEIADALTAAHRQGVVHRDLKPANVMLTKSGAKLLDFGLAKLKGHGEQAAAASFASVPTQTRPLTSEGAIVGTLQYMAPEQVDGKPADARTDLWALGAIVYEMLTGKRAFEGTSAASLIGAILEREPTPLTTLQPVTPPALDRLVRQCLAKAPDDRPDTAHDVASELRRLREASGAGALTGGQPRRRRGLRIALLGTAGCALVMAGAVGAWFVRPSPSRVSLVRTELPVRPAEDVNSGGVLPAFLPTPGGSRTALTWTPDGQALVFVGRQGGVQRLYVRRLDAAEARPLPKTEGAQVPAVSPDGQWVAFWANGAIRKVPLEGGPVMDLHPGLSVPPQGLVWDGSSRLFFGGSDRRIWAIPAEGPAAAVTTLGEAERGHSLPWPLPDGQSLLYTVRKRRWSWGDEEVVAQALATGERKVLLRDAADARYLPTGHLVFLRRGQLFAVPFDVERLKVLGTPVALLDGVAQALTAGSGDDVTGAGQFAVATTGTLAWVAAPPASYPAKLLVGVDRLGHVTPLPAAPVRSYGAVVRVSPDGRRLALTIQTLSESGVWIYDMGRGTLKLLAGGGEALFPTWSPDGQRLVFDWVSNGRYSLVMQPADADATTPPQELSAGVAPSSFTPEGQRLAAVSRGQHIVMLTIGTGEAPVQFLTQAPNELTQYPVFSPDGRWLAYASNASDRFEVYVRPYPGPGPAEPVSLEGGWCPAWNPKGGELFFLSLTDPAGNSRMMAAEFAPGSPPRIGRPRLLFEFAERDLPLRGSPVRRYDVAPDGRQFYAITNQTPQAQPAVTHINLIQNWFEELKAKVPVKR